MNASVLEPLNRLHLPHAVKVSALFSHGNKLYTGLSNGDLVIYRKTGEAERPPMRSAARSVKSFRSFSEVKRLFQDNETSQVFVHEKTFENVSKNRAPITSIRVLPLYEDNSREVLVLGTSDVLQVYEWVGAYLNLVRTFDEVRGYSEHAFLSVFDKKSMDSTKKDSKTPSENDGIVKKVSLISSRKKLYVYQVVHKSRNIFDFEVVHEVVLKERIRSLCVFEKHAKALIATAQNVYCLDLVNGYHVTDLRSDSTKSDLAQMSSFSYFGLASSGPQISLVPLNDTEAVFIRDLEVRTISLKKSTLAVTESSVRVQTSPSHVRFLAPCYLLLVYPKTLEVVDIQSGFVVQTFKHPLGSGASFCSHFSDLVSIAAGSNVFQFRMSGVQKQLDEFLAMRGNASSVRGKNSPRNDLRVLGLERAIVLIGALGDEDDFFRRDDAEKRDKSGKRDDTDIRDTSADNPENNKTGKSDGHKQKQLFLRDLYKEKVVVYFEGYRSYQESLEEWACEWMVSFHEVLSLFPHFLNGNVQIKQSKGTDVVSKHNNPIKRMTMAELQSGSNGKYDSDGRADTISETGSETRPETRSETIFETSETPETPQKIRDFRRAVHGLIVFLTDQRRVHLSFLGSGAADPYIRWKGSDLHVSDVYPGIDPKLLHTKLSDFAAVIDTSLFLCYYFTKPLLLGPLLRLPHNRCNARVVNDCLLKNRGLDRKDQLTFIIQLLDFYFGRSLHDEALRLLRNLAQDPATTSVSPLTSPSLSIRYMQRLPNEHLDLIFKYAPWVLGRDSDGLENARLVFMNDSFECEGYDRMRVLDFITNVVKNSDMAVAYLEWLLNESGLLELANTQREVPRLSTKLCLLYLQKMAAAPKTGLETFGPYQKLKDLLGSEIKYEPWTVLKNIPAGDENYLRLTVLIYYRLGEHQKSVDILYNQLGDLDEAMDYCAKVYGEVKGAEKGQNLLFKLLDDLLMHYRENEDDIARLLVLQGEKMPPLQVLVALPNSFPVHKLLPHLKETIWSLDNKQTDTRLKSQLYKVGASKVHRELVMAQATYYKIEGIDQKCARCGNPMGAKVACANHSGEIVHYGCLEELDKPIQ